MLHNFIVTYLDTRGVLKKDFVENKENERQAIAFIKQNRKVKEVLSSILET